MGTPDFDDFDFDDFIVGDLLHVPCEFARFKKYDRGD